MTSSSGRSRLASRAWAGLLIALGACCATTGLTQGTAPPGPSDPPALLGGFLAMGQELFERWCWSGAWLYPVGDPHRFDPDSLSAEPGYLVCRGLEFREDGRVTHYGVDLSNRRAGGPVRAAASGVVIRAVTRSAGGYGCHVVLAHRLEDGGIAYSVYGHLARGSLRVRAGEVVSAGALLGRVGRTGRASTNHLHFEVRLPADPSTRWENTEAVDPLEYVAERLPAHASDSTWARPYLEWAECSAVIAPSEAGETRLERLRWWTMLGRAGRHVLDDLDANAAEIRDRLVGAGLLPEDAPAALGGTLDRAELERDLELLKDVGLRLPSYPENAGPAAGDFVGPILAGADAPPRDRDRVTLAEACRRLAELSRLSSADFRKDR